MKKPGVADFEHALRSYQAGLKQEAYYFYRPEGPAVLASLWWSAQKENPLGGVHSLWPILVGCHGAPLPEQIASSKFIHADSCQTSQEAKELLQLSLHQVWLTISCGYDTCGR